MADHPNEAKAGTDAFKLFAESFGKMDDFTRVVLEELLKELLGVEDEDGDKTIG